MTLIAHELLVATVAPDKLTLPEPAAAVVVPPQVLVNPFGVEITIPAGNVSVNATPVSATPFAAGLVIVKLNVETPPGVIPAGVNAFAIDGGATTVILAEAVPPVPPCVDVTFPVVLF